MNKPKKLLIVEWIADAIHKGELSLKEILEQAKEMEKKKTIDFAKHCLDKAKDLDILTSFMNVKQYYNETFKSE